MDGIRRPIPKPPAPFPPKERVVSKIGSPTPQRITLEPPLKDVPLYTKRRIFLWRRGLRYFFIIFGIIILGLAGITALHFSKTINQIQLKTETSPSFFSQVSTLTRSLGNDPFEGLKKTDDGRINILLLGRAGEHYPGKNLTDTIILLSIDAGTRKVALISLPRDLYVTLPEERISAKINSLYQYGLSQNQSTRAIEKAVTSITGEPLHYTFILDFDGFEKIIDTFGGVDLEVARDIYDERYPGKNYSYETFALDKGWHTLDGKTALKYVRERHDDPEGDFGRAKRQQQLLTALKEKVFANSLISNINAVSSLLTILGDSVKTNASLGEMESFLRLAKKIDTQNVETVVVDAWKPESLLRVSHVELGGVRAFILLPRTGNWQEIQELSQNIFSHEQILKRKAALKEENASIAILYRKENSAQAKQILQILEEDFPGTLTLTPIADYQEWPEKSMLLERVPSEKLWSLDTLLKKLALEKTEFLPFTLLTEESDLSIVVGDNASSFLPDDLSFQENNDPEPKEGDPLIIEQTDSSL